MSWMQRLSLVRVLARSLVTRSGVLGRCQVVASCAAPGVLSREIKEFSTTPMAPSVAAIDSEQGIISRNWEKLKFLFNKKYKLRPLGWALYRDSMDRLDYLGFFKEFKLADTFFSWFLVTELHVWMLMVRLMDLGIEGSETRKNIVEAMWQDAHMRKKQLGSLKESLVVKHMSQLGQQFNASVIGYDEGLLTNDKVLAGAVWRRFLQSECNDPEIVEKLVIYIRKTMIMLDKMSFEEIINKRNPKWLDYKNLLQS